MVRSPAWIHLMCLRLFSKWAGTFFSIGFKGVGKKPWNALGGSIEVGYDRSYFNIGACFMGLDEMVEPGQIRVWRKEAFLDKRGDFILYIFDCLGWHAEHFLVGVSVIEAIKGDLCVCVLLYDAELSAFIAGEVYVVLLFEFFHSFFVCVVDNRPFLLGL